MRGHKTISIADQIFEQLEKDILTGKYLRGDILSESKLAEELGVSRTPVREAIRRLEQESIIEDSSRGMVVIGISREDIPDMYEIRIHIESLAAGRAAENISDEDLAKMEEILSMQRYYIEKQNENGVDNSEMIKDLDSKFHELIYTSCGSKPFHDVLSLLHKRTTKYRKASIRKNSRASASIAEHEEILAAIKSRDGKKAEELMKKHLINARDSIMTIEKE